MGSSVCVSVSIMIHLLLRADNLAYLNHACSSIVYCLSGVGLSALSNLIMQIHLIVNKSSFSEML